MLDCLDIHGFDYDTRTFPDSVDVSTLISDLCVAAANADVDVVLPQCLLCSYQIDIGDSSNIILEIIDTLLAHDVQSATNLIKKCISMELTSTIIKLNVVLSKHSWDDNEGFRVEPNMIYLISDLQDIL